MRINGFGRVVSVGLGIVAFFALAAPVSSAPPSGETFTLDATHSSATFRVHHMGAGPFYGRFNKVEGTIVFDGKGSLEMDVAVIVDSVDTGSERLDGHLKSPDFFNAREFPKMTFKSRSAKKTKSKKYKVTGDLTIHGVTKPITVEVEWTGTADKGRGNRCGFEAVFSIKRSEFGMDYGVGDGALGDEVKVIVGLEGVAGD